MKKIFIRLVFTAAVMLAVFVNVQADTSVNKIVAVVNSSVITADDLNTQVALIKQRLQKSNTPLPDEKTLQQQVLQQMIDRELQLQQAAGLNLTVSNKQVDEAIARVAKQNHMTKAQLLKSVEDVGFTPKSFKEEVKKEILMQMVQGREVAPRVSISAQEVNDYLNILKSSRQSLVEYHLGDILIALPESPSPEQVEAAQVKAEQLIKELRSGENFEKLAVATSGGQQALQGGDLGWRKLAELPTPFVNVTQGLKVNQVAGPIRTPNGFHVIKLLGIKNTGGLSGNAAEQRKQVEEMLFERQFNQALLNWIAQLRAQAYIKIY